MTNKPDRIIVRVSLSESLALKAAAEDRGITLSHLIRSSALKAIGEKPEKKHRARRRAEGPLRIRVRRARAETQGALAQE